MIAFKSSDKKNTRKAKKQENEPMYKSSKRLALLIFSTLYAIIVLSNLFTGRTVDDKILTSLEIIIGTCIGGITASSIFNKK